MALKGRGDKGGSVAVDRWCAVDFANWDLSIGYFFTGTDVNCLCIWLRKIIRSETRVVARGEAALVFFIWCYAMGVYLAHILALVGEILRYYWQLIIPNCMSLGITTAGKWTLSCAGSLRPQTSLLGGTVCATYLQLVTPSQNNNDSIIIVAEQATSPRFLLLSSPKPLNTPCKSLDRFYIQQPTF